MIFTKYYKQGNNWAKEKNYEIEIAIYDKKTQLGSQRKKSMKRKSIV